jgi:3-hydroxyacyl-[acyl-carrier-protein] dehydratase
LSDSGVHEFTVEINGKDPLFEGHFPSRAILPGVCTIQIIKECICSVVPGDLHFMNVEQCKFIGMIDPSIDNILDVKIICKSDNNNNIPINASVFNSNVVVCKLKATLSEAEV